MSSIDIFQPEFKELLRITELNLADSSSDTATNPMRTVDEVFGQQIITNEAERETLINSLNSDSMGAAARATHNKLYQDAIFGWSRRNHEGWIVWAEQLDDPNTSYKYGSVYATILSNDGRLKNIDPVIINQRHVPSGVKNPMENLGVLAKIIRHTNGLHDINLGEKDHSYESHLKHLAEFMVRNQLQRPKQR